LRDLYGEEMLLFKDKLIYKMPGVPGYGMHQDYSLWQDFPRELVNVIVSIDGADADNGGVEFFPGYHDRLLSTEGESRYMNEAEVDRVDLSTGESVKTEPGDIVIFDCMTPHRSGVNRASRLRRQLYLTYSSAKNGDLYEAQLEYIQRVERKKRGAAAERLFFR
jgi:ectoine hydroxylase-related dioxygenase (phytanoyl-CoA dioxygenase family)